MGQRLTLAATDGVHFINQGRKIFHGLSVVVGVEVARINVEDKIFKDQRYLDLIIDLKSVETALGAVVRCWMMGQEFWKHSDNGIPKSEWKKQRLNDALITCGLAEDRGDFVFIIGSEKHFAWIRQKVEAGSEGGIESGKARRETIEEKPKRNEAQPSAAKRSEPSSLSSLSSSLSSQDSLSFSKDEKNQKTPPANAGAFIGTYCRVWKDKYEARPEITGKEQGIAKRLTKDIGSERASELVESFLLMNDGWFLQKRHDLSTFEQNLNAVVQFHETGKTITRSDAKNIERQDSLQNQLKRIAEGEV